jgi:hypothetical protein
VLRYPVGEALDRALERLMATTEHKYLSDFARKYYDEGEAQGLRTALIALFSVRRLPLSDSGRARIASCADIGTLTQWLERAISAAAEAEVFGEGMSKGKPRRTRT